MTPNTPKTLASTAHPKATTAPTADAVAAKAAVADAASTQFSGFNGDYRYAVSAINRFGESVLTNLSLAAGINAKVTVAATESVDLKFADGGGTYPATGYRIYRSVKNTAASTAAADTFYPIFDRVLMIPTYPIFYSTI